MPHVITSRCFTKKAKECVAVCPSGAIRELDNLCVIHPDECTDCGLCAEACPNQAIYAEEFLPEQFEEFKELAKEMAGQAPRAGVRGQGSGVGE